MRRLAWLIPGAFVGLMIVADVAFVLGVSHDNANYWILSFLVGLPWSCIALLVPTVGDQPLTNAVLLFAMTTAAQLVTLVPLVRLALWATGRPAPRWLTLPRRSLAWLFPVVYLGLMITADVLWATERVPQGSLESAGDFLSLALGLPWSGLMVLNSTTGPTGANWMVGIAQLVNLALLTWVVLRVTRRAGARGLSRRRPG